MSNQIKKNYYKQVIQIAFLKMLAAVLLMQIQFGELSAQKEFEKSVKFETLNFESYFRNNGHLGESPAGVTGISWPRGEFSRPLVYDHGFWVIGFQNDTLVGAVPFWDANYSPGPMIDGQAAVIVAPQDSNLYRSYLLTDSSGPGDPDFDEWPAQWGAPTNPDGTPGLLGDVMLWTVYNDAHPDVHGFIETWTDSTPYNTNVEVRETVWGYNDEGLLGDILFFKWQVFNKGNSTLDSVVFSHWNDFDLQHLLVNSPNFNLDRNFGLLYYDDSDPLTPQAAVAASYLLLQGPIVPSSGDTAIAFGSEILGFRNLQTTAYWWIVDDSAIPSVIGGSPHSVAHAYNFSNGRTYDASPIVNPVTGEVTTFSFNGDPLTGEGWLFEGGGGGGAGYIVSSGTFTMEPGDSQEVIFALVPAPGNSFKEAIVELYSRVDSLRSLLGISVIVSAVDKPSIPTAFNLAQNYPNPFNPVTNIQYSLPVRSEVRLIIYNLRGQEIARLVDGEEKPTGVHSAVWNAATAASGLYFYRLTAGDYVKTKKMVLLK